MRNFTHVNTTLFAMDAAINWAAALLGILRNPDRIRTQTRTRTGRKPGLDKNPDPTLGLTFRKKRTGFYKTRTRY